MRSKTFTCHYCFGRFPIEKRTKDHIKPRTRGFGDYDSTGSSNIVWACKPCNQAKADMPYEEFVDRRRPKLVGIRKPDGTFLEPKQNFNA